MEIGRSVGLYLHEKSVSVVHGISQLKGEDGVGPNRLELVPQLLRRQSVLVQPVVPLDALQGLNLAAHQPVARLHYLKSTPAGTPLMTHDYDVMTLVTLMSYELMNL